MNAPRRFLTAIEPPSFEPIGVHLARIFGDLNDLLPQLIQDLRMEATKDDEGKTLVSQQTLRGGFYLRKLQELTKARWETFHAQAKTMVDLPVEPGPIVPKFETHMNRQLSWKDIAIEQARRLAVAEGRPFDAETFEREIKDAIPKTATLGFDLVEVV